MFEEIIYTICGILWSPALVIVLVFAGLYFSIRTRFVQVRRFRLMAALLFPKKKKNIPEKTIEEAENLDDVEEVIEEKISSFKTFCMALSGRVGTGNIVGVATAIAYGGPGAVFWMWVIAFLGASTAFMESTLANMYRFHYKKGWRGGPFAYIEYGLGMRWLGIIFAIFTILGYGVACIPVQSNAVSKAVENSFSISPLTTGLLLVALLLMVTLGGMKRIAKVAGIITPLMAVMYVGMGLMICFVHYDRIPRVFTSIIQGAFGLDSALGGIIGTTIAMGVKRGLYSNEAGQGGGAIVSAIAHVDQPAKQGLVQAFSVYIDTLVVCTCTAFMILSTGQYNIYDAATGAALLTNVPELGTNYVAYTQTAIDQVFTGFGGGFVAIALAFFVYTTFVAFNVYADSSIIYLCRTFKSKDRTLQKVRGAYSVVFCIMIIFGCLWTSELSWAVGDIGLGLTTWINIIVLFFLCPKALKALKELEESLRGNVKNQ